MTKDDDDSWLEGGDDGSATATESNDPTITDKHGLALLTGLAPKEIDRALREGLPTHGRRERGKVTKFRVPDCVQWLLHEKENHGNSLNVAKAKERTAMARRREIEVAQMEGRLVEVDSVVATITDQVARLQSELMTIPTRLVVPPDVRDTVRAEIVAAIGRLAFKGATE